ncbi:MULTISPECIES: hypothetical protein [unclassified Carboxydocella]|uniref:hypothetical protein n=1 Tax=unclassified Carboxydocella TaxID=2685367 RepID=UPI0009ACBE05|nr:MULTISPECIES: hypothetical protein [unclassified Carboxydocella]GAW28747.1 hypothetical protein ULO1_13170 [Carboxydocella sp. ULO1]GAW32579.1 hypothetical protein JDF658_23440 [Carboxydocella sp. JDF658]
MENKWLRLAVVSLAGLVFSILGLNLIQAISGGDSSAHGGSAMVHGQQGAAVVQYQGQAFEGYPNHNYMGNMPQHFQMNQGQAEYYNNMLPAMYYNMQMMRMQMQQMRQTLHQLHEQMKANMNSGMSNMPMM